MCSKKARLTTPCEVQTYLDQISSLPTFPFPAVEDVANLPAGVNFTFRLSFRNAYKTCDSQGQPLNVRSVILKHAEEHVARQPQISFDRRRQLYEIQALKNVPKLLSGDHKKVHLPQVFYHDADNDAFMMEDVSPTVSCDSGKMKERSHSLSLRDICRQMNECHQDLALACEMGITLGRFFAELHSVRQPFSQVVSEGFPHKNMGSRVVCAKTAFGDFLQSIENFGIKLEIQRKNEIHKIMHEMTEKVLCAEEALVMGDFWYAIQMTDLFSPLHFASDFKGIG